MKRLSKASLKRWLLTLPWRFIVRMWYMHRNQALVKSAKILRNALHARRSIVLGVPKSRRAELVQNDLVLSVAASLAADLNEYLEGVGYAK